MATFCLIHCAWHEPSCWDELAPLLLERDHRVVIPDLPLHDPEAGFEQRVAPALEAVEGVEGPLVIVGHSQATGYSSLVAAAHPDAGLVHLCPRLGGFEPPGAPDPFQEGIPWPESGPNGATAWREEAAVSFMYGRVPEPRASMLAGRLRPMAMPPDDLPLDGPPENRTILIYAADDEFFRPEFERFMARKVFGIEPIEIVGGHFPMAEDPAALAELLDRVAAG